MPSMRGILMSKMPRSGGAWLSFQSRRSAVVGLDLKPFGFEQHRHRCEDVAIVVDEGCSCARLGFLCSGQRLLHHAIIDRVVAAAFRVHKHQTNNCGFFDPKMTTGRMAPHRARPSARPRPGLPGHHPAGRIGRLAHASLVLVAVDHEICRC